MFCQDTTANWTYATATVRAANANTTDGTGRVSFVSWLPAVPVEASCFCGCGNAVGVGVSIGIGLDSTSAFNTSAQFITGLTSENNQFNQACAYAGTTTTGFHYLQRLEYTGGATSTFYYSNGTGGTSLNGLTSSINN